MRLAMSSDALTLALEDDLRYDDEIVRIRIDSMKKWLRYRGINVPRYLSDEQVVKYYREWCKE